jgi:peptidoglycan/xylan/chitin deacetylase (PgdA/CDA1 family)
MYHSISDDPEPGVHPYYRLCTSPRCFTEQMRWLADNGYRGVTLTEGLAWLSAAQTGVRHPASGLQHPASSIRAFRPIALTFDDGFHDFYSTAWPVLREHGFHATVYLPTAFIGDTRRRFAPSPRRGEGRGAAPPSSIRHTPSSVRGRDCLTWPEVRELYTAGVEIGSHTVSHPVLHDLSWPDMESEISNSKSEIEHRLGVRVTAFAHPYAFPQEIPDYSRRFAGLLKTAGYDSGVTTQVGRARPCDNRWLLRRLPVNDLDGLKLFQAKLEGAYDWLGPCQTRIRQARYLLRVGGAKPRHHDKVPARLTCGNVA